MRRITVFFYLSLVCLLPTPVLGEISFNNGVWTTTFNCNEWEQGAPLSCDGLGMYGAWTANGDKDQIVGDGDSGGDANDSSLPKDPSIPIEILFEDPIEEEGFLGRGWYDYTTPALTAAEFAPGSSRSIEYKFPEGAQKPDNGSAMRFKFRESDAVYVSYYVKYSANWVGSQKNYHPHEFHLLTNKDGERSGLASTNLTAYIEQNALRPQMTIQDSQNIDLNRVGEDLVDQTENRGVAGCNGDSDGHGQGDCYPHGGVYRNGKLWRAEDARISAGRWHKIEAFFKLNSVVDDKGVADGVIQYWLDGTKLIDHQNVMLRTARHADMKFNQFIIAPWIGDGSPIEQTFWVDHIVIGTQPEPGTSTCTDGIQNGQETGVDCGGTCAPCPPTGLKVAFSYDQLPSADNPLTVNFTDASSGSPTSWQWDFDGDGKVDATDQNPQHMFPAPGQYQVTMTASNGQGSDRTTMTVTVTDGAVDPSGNGGDNGTDGSGATDSSGGDSSSSGNGGADNSGGCLIGTAMERR